MAIDALDRRRTEPREADLSPSATAASTTRDESLRRELNVSEYPDYPQPMYASLGAVSGVVGTAQAARPKTAGEKIDDLVAKYSGPYDVDGKKVSAPPMFKLARPYASQTRANDLAKIVGSEVARRAQSSQGGPAAIKQATQMLIDAGELPKGPGPVDARIKQMQWKFGIGIDCACFTHHALTAVTGKSDQQLGIEPWDGFRGLDSNPNFSKVKLENVQAGDVMTLDPRPPETIGHNVIVRSAFTTDSYPSMSGTGPHRVISVDSSWGAGGNGQVTGGYRRDTWIYDESTKDWGFYRAGSKDIVISSEGPSDFDKYHGAYRVKP